MCYILQLNDFMYIYMLYIISTYTTVTTFGLADHRIRADLEAIRQIPTPRALYRALYFYVFSMA